ncbi:MAG: hypothetical protein JXB19_00480 [Bacteroidales bacterium]|nr:hypothetical protein [Bacteroidales bacterium]
MKKCLSMLLLIENYVGNHKDIGNGIIMPYSMDTRVNGQSAQLIKYNTITVNADIPDELFEYQGK